jgi:hypothetical protein
MSNIAMDNGKRIQAVDLITLAMGRLQRVYDSPQTSSHHSETKIALADLKIALDVLTELSNTNHRRQRIDSGLRMAKDSRVVSTHSRQLLCLPSSYPQSRCISLCTSQRTSSKRSTRSTPCI